jgi:uncharacterized protein YndB with AHSA1/START domain
VKSQNSSDLSVTRTVDAPADEVFDAWIDPARAKKFLFATANGEMVKAETDPRVGGKFTFVDRRDGQDVTHIGTYVELVRPARIVFDFIVPPFSTVPTRIEVEIVERGSESDVTLTHRNVPKDHAEKARGGWTTILNGLASSLNS